MQCTSTFICIYKLNPINVESIGKVHKMLFNLDKCCWGLLNQSKGNKWISFAWNHLKSQNSQVEQVKKAYTTECPCRAMSGLPFAKPSNLVNSSVCTLSVLNIVDISVSNNLCDSNKFKSGFALYDFIAFDPIAFERDFCWFYYTFVYIYT